MANYRFSKSPTVLFARATRKTVFLTCNKKSLNAGVFFIILFFFLSVFTLYGRDYEVKVVQMEWHSSLILETGDIPDSILKKMPGRLDGSYVDISWGDQKFYQAEGRPVYYAVAAVLWPTSAVIRIRNWHRLESILNGSKREVNISISEMQFIRLCQFITRSFVRNENGELVPGRENTFYLAKRSYSIFRTCHTWIALALNDAGLDIDPFIVINANSLFGQLKE